MSITSGENWSLPRIGRDARDHCSNLPLEECYRASFQKLSSIKVQHTVIVSKARNLLLINLPMIIVPKLTIFNGYAPWILSRLIVVSMPFRETVVWFGKLVSRHLLQSLFDVSPSASSSRIFTDFYRNEFVMEFLFLIGFLQSN